MGLVVVLAAVGARLLLLRLLLLAVLALREEEFRFFWLLATLVALFRLTLLLLPVVTALFLAELSVLLFRLDLGAVFLGFALLFAAPLLLLEGAIFFLG